MYDKKLEEYFNKYYKGISSDTLKFIMTSTLSDRLFKIRTKYGFRIDLVYIIIQLILMVVGVVLDIVFNLSLMPYIAVSVWIILGLTIYNHKIMKKVADSQNELISDMYAMIDLFEFSPIKKSENNSNKNIAIYDLDDMEYSLGDIVYNEKSDDYWVVQEVTDVDKSSFNIDTDYCLARFNNKLSGCVALKAGLEYRIVLRPGEPDYNETIEEFNKYVD